MPEHDCSVEQHRSMHLCLAILFALLLVERVQPVMSMPCSNRTTISDGSKKGIGTWDSQDTYADASLAKSNTSWYYSWTWHSYLKPPFDSEFVPMVWGTEDITDESLDELQNYDTLLTFNEGGLSCKV